MNVLLIYFFSSFVVKIIEVKLFHLMLIKFSYEERRTSRKRKKTIQRLRKKYRLDMNTFIIEYYFLILS